jgi:cytochrome P450
MRVAASLIGVPESDLPQIMRWADALEQVGGDLGLEELKAAGREFSAMRGYIIEHFERKKTEPGDDLLSVLATAEVDSEKLSEDNVQMLTMLVLAAGSDTTRSMLCGMIDAFAHYPEQYQAVRADRSLVPGAIEESLRWSTPARAFMRTATQDTEIRGQKIAAGQHLYMLYMAGNHDEEIFPHPERFDVGRKENIHQLSFGFGTHVCIAAALVRLEGQILLNAMLDRFSSVDLAGEPVPVIALLRNGWTEMSAVFHA